MFKFKINTDNCKKLIAICGQVSSIVDKTKPIYTISDNKLNFYLYSSEIIFTNSIEVSSVENDTDNDFFSIDIQDFIGTLQNVSEQEKYDVTITVDNENNKVIFKNEETGTSICRSNLECQTTSDEVSEAKEAISSKLSSEFNEGAHEIKINNELINFVDTMSKFMSITLNTNSVNVKNNIVKYADTLAIVEKKLSEEVSSSDTDIRICKILTDFLKPFVKVVGAINVKLREDDCRAYIKSDDFGFEAILSFPIPTYEYPSEEELESFLAEPTDCVKAEISKDDILGAFSKFDGVFKTSNWDWKATNMNTSQESLSSGKVRLHHDDYLCAVETYLPITVLENSENVANYTENGSEIDRKVDFLFSISSVSDILSIVAEDKIGIMFNRLDTSEPHGAGIKIFTPTVSACVCKFINQKM